jgi:hypothetical protein
MGKKIYYSVFTVNEKIWIHADTSETLDGCLVFSDFDEDGTKVTIAAFQKGYWLYCYEADEVTGESISEAIPFWKRHSKIDTSTRSQSPSKFNHLTVNGSI